MNIEKYVSSQYAGTNGRDISFQPGMNVILGANEAGKSTMISGIMDALLRHVKLDRRIVSDKDFLEQKFPSNGMNYIDGEVFLTLAGERVAIRKEWDKVDPKESRIILRYLDLGKRATATAAEEELKKLLQYGNAVYEKIIFGRQDNEEDILNWLYSFLQDGTTDDLVEVKKQVAGAAAAASGISEELVLKKLEEKLDELSKLWDFSLDRPKDGRGLNNPWKNKLGKILDAYYAWQETSLDYEDARSLIRQTKEAEQKLETQQKEKQGLQEDQKKLQQQQAAVQNAGLLQKQASSLEAELKKLTEDRENWPKLQDEQKRLKGLVAEETERQRRAEKAKLEKILADVAACDGEITRCQEATAGKENIEADAKACRSLLEEIDRIDIQLTTAKLTTQITLQSGHQADVETGDGLVVQGVSDYSEVANGYVKVTISGVGEVMVTPENLDVDALKRNREEKQQECWTILDKYGVETCDALEQAASVYRENKTALDAQMNKRETLLAGRTVKEITVAAQGITLTPDLVIGDDLDQRIRDALASCREATLDSRSAVVTNQLAALEKEYSSREELEKRHSAATENLSKTRENLAQVGEVPMTQEEFNQKTQEIEQKLETLEKEMEKGNREYGSLAEKADEVDLDVLQEERDALESQWKHQKWLHAQYRQIRDDFRRLLEQQEDQYSGFYELFNRYLSEATGGSLLISSENTVVSKGNTLGKKELLSTGTKKVILLAFRLALLKYYFPEESGVVVLDDILLDMDPGRREAAVKLLSEFSKENQVIFTTCDPAIAELLGGNLIKL